MSRAKRLQPIADLAAHSEHEASKELAEIQTRLEQQENLLQDLELYHAEYTTGTIISSIASADAVRLQDYRLFLDRLENAIVRQHELIGRLRREFDQIHARWTDRRSHRKALDNVTGRYARAEAHVKDVEEQNQIEEVSALLRTRKLVTS